MFSSDFKWRHLEGISSVCRIACSGMTLGGWCERNSGTVFGQWLGGMARLYRATGDSALRDKAVTLASEFAKTIKPDGDVVMRHYPFDKLVCGLVELARYGDYPEAVTTLDRVSIFAIKNFDRTNHPAIGGRSYSGKPSEWYTLGENLYRAYVQTGERQYEDSLRLGCTGSIGPIRENIQPRRCARVHT